MRAGAWATLCTGLLGAAVVVGSRNLHNFDAALVIYTFAVVFATWGIAYHYAVWMQKPPTRMYWRRGLQLVRRRGVARSLARVGRAAGTHLVAQTFIYRRSKRRCAKFRTRMTRLHKTVLSRTATGSPTSISTARRCNGSNRWPCP